MKHYRLVRTRLVAYTFWASAPCSQLVTRQLLVTKGAITSNIKHAIKHKKVLQDLHNCCSPHWHFVFSLQQMTAYRPGLDETPSLAATAS